MQSSILVASAGLLLSASLACAATPDQLYQTWQKDYRLQPDTAEKAAEDYLRLAPGGPQAHSLQIWLDAYHKNLASLLSTAPQALRPRAPEFKQATAQPSPSSRVPAPPPPADRPPETRQATVIPQEPSAPKQQPSQAPRITAPGPKRQDQSLVETLAFLADRLDGEGSINFVAQFHDVVGHRDFDERLSYRASNVTIDPNRCRVSFHWHVVQDGKATPDQDRTVELRLAKNITVETIDQALTDLNAGARPLTVRARPALYAVHIGRWDKPLGDNLYFHDKDMAARVAGAGKHALDLCEDKASQSLRHR